MGSTPDLYAYTLVHLPRSQHHSSSQNNTWDVILNGLHLNTVSIFTLGNHTDEILLPKI